MSGRPRIVFVDHSFHKVTRSSAFFTTLLGEWADVIAIDSESWRRGANVSAARIDAEGADVAVFWQTLADPGQLFRLRTPAVWVPMFDSAVHSPAVFWRVFARTGARILSFCRALSATARRYGIPVSDYTYFPDPELVPQRRAGGDGLRLFFWDRGYTRFDLLRATVDPAAVSCTTVRRAPNPGLSASPVTARDVRDYKVTFCDGVLGRAQYLDLLADCDVFFAPRRYEGIGMTFLEAMAMGLAVVAADSPTMNEYISVGVDGFLFDPDRPAPVDLRTARDAGARARETMRRGREAWLRSAEGLRSDLLAARPAPAPPGPGVLLLAALLTAGERAKALVPAERRAALTEAVRRRTTGS